MKIPLFKNDLALRNAAPNSAWPIITMNPQQPRAEALAVRDGRIVAVGAWEEVAPHTEGATVLDITSKTVLPGLIDTHTHFLWTALSLAALDVSGAKDHPSLQAIIRKAVADAPPGELIFGMGFTEYALNTDKFSPIITALDAAAPDNPVCLIVVTGHTSAVNSRGLELLAAPDGTPGIMRDSSGRPNGLLADKANNLAFDRFGEQFGADEKAAEMIALAIEKAHSVGITTLHALEGGISGRDEATKAFLAAIPSLPLRFVFYYQVMDVDKVIELGLPRIGGCILLDGDVGPHTAAFTEPYADDLKCYGVLYYTQKEVDAFVLRAHEAGLQVAMHAIGDAAIEQALNAYQAALNIHPREDHRHRIEHCDLIREDQIQRAQQLGLALAIQPPFNHYWSHTEYIPTLGEERASRADPFRAMMNAGLLLAGGSDSTVTPLGPLIGVHAAVSHSNPVERLSVQEGLELYTINAARIAFQEADRGSLEVGKLGDFVVLAEDPFEVDPNRIKDIPVEMTVIVELVQAATGSDEFRPIFSAVDCTISPLMHDGPMTEACIELAKLQVPIMVYPMPLAGGTSPVTLGSTILLHNIEFLSGLALFQAVNPGMPIIYGCGASQLDMHTGRYGGSADGYGLGPVLGEIAHFYNLPVNLGGLDTASHHLDAQYGYEATVHCLLSYLAGADEIYSIGLLGSAQVLSLDKMVLDNHLAHQLETMLKPILTDEEHLQVDLIERVGIGGTYLTQRETRDLTRSEYVPVWPPAGKTAMEVVHEEALDILHNHQPPPLPEGAANKIEAIVAEADRVLG